MNILTLLLPLVMSTSASQVHLTEVGHVFNPHWSQDGRHLAFEVNRYGDAVDLYVVKMDGTTPGVPAKVAIPGVTSSFSSRGSVVAHPVWHPEGNVIFEGSNSAGTQRLYYWAPGGQSAAELLSSGKIGGDLTWPSISQDGSRLVFVSDSTGSGDIYTWDQSSNKVSPTFSTPGSAAAPQFSPDGGAIAFTAKNRGNEDLFLWKGAGSPDLLKGGNGDQTRPVWAGDQVVYFTNERGEGHWDIAVTGKDGGARRILARDVRLPMRAAPALGPDGSAVICTMSEPAKADRLMVSTLDGSKTVEIATGLVACAEPDMIKVGNKIYAAFTALPASGSDWRQLHVVDVTGKLP